MRARILTPFSIDGPPERRFDAGEVVDHADAGLWIEKGLAEPVGDARRPEPLMPPEPAATAEMSWPELRRLASEVAGEPVRSRAEAEAVLASRPAPEPDAA